MQGGTVVAKATGEGGSAIGIVRASGPLVAQWVQKIKKEAKPREAYLVDLEGIDQGILLWFKGPHSYTGEDVIEFQGHGNPCVMDAVVDLFLSWGGQPAPPGVFTQRAFLNGKMDLVQAEAVADLIHAQSLLAAKKARGALEGFFSKDIKELASLIKDIRVWLEAGIDFSDQDIDWSLQGDLKKKMNKLKGRLGTMISSSKGHQVLTEGLDIVIVGPPNAGKSSLFNSLVGSEEAIVSAAPGTTRDAVKQSMVWDGVPVRFVDTCGIRETQDLVEKEGVLRTMREAENADVVLLVLDVNAISGEDIEFWKQKVKSVGTHVMVVLNKEDLLHQETRLGVQGAYAVSALERTGLALLKKSVIGHFVSKEETPSRWLARKRHVYGLSEALSFAEKAEVFLVREDVVSAACELRMAQEALEGLLGEYTQDALLGDIFSSFCIGK